MKNITISIDDDLYRQARIKAVEQSTSISALFSRSTPSPRRARERQDYISLTDIARYRNPDESFAAINT